jgi:hypothetical protein
MRIRHHKTSIALAAAAIVAVAVLLLTTLPKTEGEPPESAPVEVYSPFGLFGPGTLEALPTSASQTVLNTLGFDSLGRFQDYSLALTKELGVSWVRLDFPYDGWKFIESADYVDKLHASGIDVVGCVLPINSFAPADLTSFEANLRQLILRYPWIRVWQIGNEPDLSWDNPDDYPRFFFAGQRVVRENCPDCKVALAGAGARWPGQDLDGWRHSLDIYDRIIGDIASQAPEDMQPFDIVDMHYYDFYGTSEAMLGTLREYRDLPRKYGLSNDIEFWVTECATPNGDLAWPPDAPSQTEEQQASELVSRFVTMLGAQVKRVSWARIYDNYRYHDTEGGFFDHSGLIYNGLGSGSGTAVKAGTKKLGYSAYRTLISKLSGCAQVQRLGPGKYKFDFDGDRRPLYVLWDVGGAEPPADLTGPILVTDLEGKTSETLGEQLTLGPLPFFVEKL